MIAYLWTKVILQLVANKLTGRKLGHERHICMCFCLVPRLAKLPCKFAR